MVAISIDAGTSMIKAVAYDDEGRELAVSREETTVLRPRPSHSEQDMLEVWDAVVTTVRGVHRQVDGAPVTRIALTGQGDGCWLVDAQGRPTGPAALWSDGRAAEQVNRWEADGVLEKAFRINGSLTFPGLPNGILSWYRRNDPERLERSDKALYCDSWVFYNMTGEVAVDESDASNPLLDIRSREYSPELRELYGIEWAERLLPEIRDDDHRTADLTPSAADQLGLEPGIPVTMASFDIAATAIGVGAVSAGSACTILGTTLCTEVVIDEPITDGDPAGMTVALGVPGLYMRAFPTLAGTEVIRWTMDLLGLDEPRQLGELAAQAGPGAGNLMFLPYMSPAGERAPFLDTNARGSWHGLSLEHGRPHIARAVFEGLTMMIRDCFAASQATSKELRLCGGGTASDLWCQMIADATGLPTLRSDDSELGAKGSFIASKVYTGDEPGFAQAAQRYVSIRDTFEPDPQTHERYEQLYADFLELRGHEREVWPKLAELRAQHD